LHSIKASKTVGACQAFLISIARLSSNPQGEQSGSFKDKSGASASPQLMT
jgi:hypothetical protein